MDNSQIAPIDPHGRSVQPRTAGLSVLYEDDALLVVDKSPGMVAHPAYKHPSGTLADAVFARQAARGETRPWLLHRLDRGTSGVVLFAKTDAARRSLVRQFERRTVKKLYLALASAAPAPAMGTIQAALLRDPSDRRRVIVHADGQSACTRYLTIEARPAGALLLVRPATGRTHQIRAHLAHIGATLLGDTTYARPLAEPPFDAGRALLHAWRVQVLYPGTGAPLVVTAPLPRDFDDALARLGLHAPRDEMLVALSTML